MNLAASHTLPQSVSIKELIPKQITGYSLFIAVCVIGVWAISLTALLTLNLAHFPVWLIPLAVLWQMFLYTGLFITAHDAMHGSVCSYSKINHFIGSLAVTIYGLFSYKELSEKHGLHHRYPASDRDPDFHDSQSSHPVLWYFCFMRRYWSWQRFVGLIAIYQVLHFVLQIADVNLLLFWMLPSIFSSVQLFYFGTFLTHQEPAEGFKNRHRAQTNSLPTFWSFLTCYHFGYHEEHHEYPYIPWWQLPNVHKMLSSRAN